MSPELLRAWETRYGVPVPERTSGGLRVYPEPELERLRAMRDLVEEGMAPAEAARAVGTAERAEAPAAGEIEPLASELAERLEAFDDDGAQAVLDRLLASFSSEIVVGEVILPSLERLGDRWATGEVSVAQEHFASTLLRGRLLALGRGWDRGVGPRAVLACPSGELHDLGLIAFGLALRTHGWRITYLGQDTPIDTVISAVAALRPAVLVLGATDPQNLERIADKTAQIGPPTKLFLGGRGATGPGIALPLDPGEAAREVVRTHRR